MTEQTVSLIEKLEAEKIQCSSSIANNDIVIKCHNEAIDMCCEIIRQHQAEQPDDVVEQMFNEVMPEVKFITIPPPDTLNDCRTAFEEWAAAYPLWLSKQANGSYVREATETAWDSWQAAWNLRNGVSSEMWQTADGRPIFGVGSPHDIEKHIDAIVAEPSEIPATAFALYSPSVNTFISIYDTLEAAKLHCSPHDVIVPLCRTSERHGKPSEIPAVDEDFYHVEIDELGCADCARGATYIIVSKDKTATSTAYEDCEAAEEMCADLNHAIAAYKLWNHQQREIPVVDAPEWYNKQEIFDALIGMNYAPDSAEELSGWFADAMQKAFNKGWQKHKAMERELSGWQPIETAPKDGTHVLAWNGTEMYVVRWSRKPYPCWMLAGCNAYDADPLKWRPLPKINSIEDGAGK